MVHTWNYWSAVATVDASSASMQNIGMSEPGIIEIYERLGAAIGEVAPLIVFDSAFQLLIAVILSAQTTDELVNRVTPGLFGEYPDAESLACAPIEELERIVFATGFYRMKAKHIRGAAKTLVERFGGRVPRTIDELVTIPGVGRKSANVVVGACFGKPAIIVDTHFRRVSTRLGLTASEDPGRIEYELRARVSEAIQYRFSMLVNRHGRATCTARDPRCGSCVLRTLCPWPGKAACSGELDRRSSSTRVPVAQNREREQ